jgi:hypothetical protein
VKKFVLPAVLAIALVLPAAAMAATKTYGGKFKGGGKISVDIGVQNKKPATVEATRFKNLPATCETAGAVVLQGEIGWTGFVVQSGKFAGHDIPLQGGGTADFTGTFSHKNRQLDGKFKLTDTSVEGDTCSTDRVRYHAERGAPGPKVSKRATMIVRSR